MLDFFRRYQHYFFGVIAVVIILSFCFFGTQHSFSRPETIKDHCIGKGVDGSKIMKSEMDQMVRFLRSDRNDTALAEKGIMPNFFNDGVIRKDLLEEGIGLLLVEAYFDGLKKELQDKAHSHKHFRPYIHPYAPFISLKNLWAQVLPKQQANLDRFFDQRGEMDPETFSLLVDLYLGESAFPPHILREYLMFQEKSCDWIRPDPTLSNARLSVFQCASIEDWFGSKFLELSAQFIINSAAYAKKLGYKVSKKEAQIDLFQKGFESLQMQMHKLDVSIKEVEDLWQKQLQSLRMEEKEAVALWQKVLLFRRLFQEVGASVFVDPYLHEAFYGFALKTAYVDLYHLSKGLEIKDFDSFMELEYYLDQVSENKKRCSFLPDTFSSIETIEKKCPQLIEQRLLVEVGEVQKDEVALNVSLKETWEWQLQKENYALLEQEFPELSLHRGEDLYNYFAVLEKVHPDLKEKIDHFSRSKIVDSHPEWIEEALSQKHIVKREISISPTNETCLFGGKEVVDLFKKALLKQELDGEREAVEARQKLEMYSGDGETYYSFHILDRDLNQSVLTFEEARERGILSSLLNRHLETVYLNIRSQYPELFKGEDGQWYPLEKIKNALGKIVYAKRLEAIDQELRHYGIEKSENNDLNHFYPKYCLYPSLYQARQTLIEGKNAKDVLKQPLSQGIEDCLHPKEGLAAQWRLIKTQKVFKNCEKSVSILPILFSMNEEDWSELNGDDECSFHFFQLKKKEVPTHHFSSQIKKGQTLLARESKRHFMKDFLNLLKQENRIHLSDDNSEGA